MAMPDLHFMGYWRWKLRAWFVSEKDIRLKTNKQKPTPKFQTNQRNQSATQKKKSAVQFKPEYFIFIYLYLAEIVNHSLMVSKKIESFLPCFLPSLFCALLSQPNSRRVISYITQFRFVSCASGRKERAPIWMFIGVKSAILFMKRYLSNLFLEDICILVFKMR